MNILYLITADLNIGGAQKDIVAFASEFTKKGHKIVVACRGGGILEKDIVNLGAKYHNVDCHFRSFLSLLNTVKNISKIIHDEKIDIIAPQSIRTSIAAFLANRKNKKPIITTIHNVGLSLYAFVSGVILTITSDLIIFESEYEQRRLICSGLNRHKTVVVHSGIDLERFKPQPKDNVLLEKIGLHPDNFIIGTLARLSAEKGQKYLIEAMKQVKLLAPQAKLMIVGDGPLKETLMNQSERLGLNNDIKFLGEQRDVERYLGLVDLFVLPSIRESFSQSLREAMAMGKPVIATNVGGAAEIITDEANGVLVPRKDIKKLADAIISLIRDKNKLQGMAQLNRLRIKNLFDKNRWLETNEKIMLNTINQRRYVKMPNMAIRNLLSLPCYILSKLTENNGIRILMYHRVNADYPSNRLCVKTNEFRKQMEFLHKNGYEVMALADAYNQLPSAGHQCPKPDKPKIVITFDDGFEDNYTNAYPILKEYGFSATIFLTVNSIDKRGFLSWEQIKEMSQSSITFGAHTVSHPELTKIPLDSAKGEIIGSKENIEAKSLKCNFFCYPKGDFNQTIKDIVREAGFKAACSIKPGTNFPGRQDLMELKRTEISGFDSIFDFRKKLAGAYDLLHKLAQLRTMVRLRSPQANQALSTKNRINILYVIWSLGLGGAEQVVINLAKNLDKQKFNPIVCCLNDKGVFAEELEKEGIEVIPLAKKHKFDISVIKSLINIIKQYKIDIVHTHLWGANFWGRIAAKLSGVKVIIATEHNIDVWKTSLHLFLDKLLSFITDKIIVVSNKVGEFYAQKAHIAKNKIRVIYNGIDIGRFNRDINSGQKRESLGISNDEKVIAIIGRLVPQKGHRYFLRALKKLTACGLNVKGLIIGSGELEAELKEYSASLGLNGKVLFMGLRKDVDTILPIVDILALPSLREGMPIAALEAMACGIPVVATDVGGNREVITDGVTGYIVPPEDDALLAEKIKILIEDRALANSFADAGRKRIRESFSNSQMLKASEGLYTELFNK
ncbi:MAG: GT4 family glycosyltransferase PelF [Candidatus Omnitrophota bacterium]|nr:GT4 family glycosyltransferase PelF [Candidatus Omnitrophota bacterium]